MPLDRKTVIRVLMTERDRLYAYIWSLIGDVHLAEDVLQEVSLLAADKADEVSNEQALAAWLRTAARNKALEAIRTRAKQPGALDASVIDLLDAEWRQYDTVDSSDMVEALRHCLAELTPNNRRIIQLRYVDNLKAAEIANVLRRSTASVYQSITRTHKALGECVTAELAQTDDSTSGASGGEEGNDV